MKCANHPAEDAVGLCSGCGRALCPECQVGIEQVMCSPCLVAHNSQVIRQFSIQLGLGAVCGLLVFSLASSMPIPAGQMTLLTFMGACFPFGWAALSKYFAPGGGYFGAMARWMSLAFHIATSAVLGCIVGPYQIYVALREINKGRMANRTVNHH